MDNKNAPQKRGTNDVPHFITEEERKALYETVCGDDAEEAMAPEAVEARERALKEKRERQGQKYFRDAALSDSPEGWASRQAMGRFRAYQGKHKFHPDQFIGYDISKVNKPRWSYYD